MSNWICHHRGRPCPVCKTPSDRCASRSDGLVTCRAAEPPTEHPGFRMVGPTKDGSGFLYSVGEGGSPSGRTFTPPPAKPKVPDRPPRDWQRLHSFFASQFTPARREQLARALGLPPAVLDMLPIGYAPRDQAFTFGETDAEGRTVGLNRRFPDGSKRMITGSSRGLYVPRGWDQGGGPILIVEGASDVLACVAAGLQAVGRPSALGGVGLLAQLFADLPSDREVLVVAERDEKASGLWPGRDAAISVAKQLSGRLGRRVRWSLPPAPHKDARAWLVATGKVQHG